MVQSLNILNQNSNVISMHEAITGIKCGYFFSSPLLLLVVWPPLAPVFPQTLQLKCRINSGHKKDVGSHREPHSPVLQAESPPLGSPQVPLRGTGKKDPELERPWDE
jgi:hypothetical protein